MPSKMAVGRSDRTHTEHLRKLVIYEERQRLVTLEIDSQGQCKIVSRRDIAGGCDAGFEFDQIVDRVDAGLVDFDKFSSFKSGNDDRLVISFRLVLQARNLQLKARKLYRDTMKSSKISSHAERSNAAFAEVDEAFEIPIVRVRRYCVGGDASSANFSFGTDKSVPHNYIAEKLRIIIREHC